MGSSGSVSDTIATDTEHSQKYQNGCCTVNKLTFQQYRCSVSDIPSQLCIYVYQNWCC